MITYQTSKNEVLYDFKMLTDVLRVHPSYLKRVIKEYGFKETDYIRYKNRHLYCENAVVEFVTYLVAEKLKTELRKMEKAVDKI